MKRRPPKEQVNRQFSTHLSTRRAPFLRDDPDTIPDKNAPELSRMMRRCFNCHHEYRTAAQATMCEQWHEAGEPEN